MRVISIHDITYTSTPLPYTERLKHKSFEHGGDMLPDQYDEYVKIWRNLSYDFVPYSKELKLNKNDIILFGDRYHFYEGWLLLKKQHLLKNTICVLIESSVVDKYCSKRIMLKIRNAFPVFMTYQDDIIDNQKYFKHYPAINIPATLEPSAVPWEKKGLAAIVCTNQLYEEEPGEYYSERKRVIEYFESHEEYEFGLFGRKWDHYRNWKGCIKSKADIYHNYKFAICLENARINGYITEKIFDCMIQGIVPVYGGAYNVTSYIPQDCFIDYFQFHSLDEMVQYLASMEEDTYNQYLDNITRFLKSEECLKFRSQESAYLENEVIKHLPEKFSLGIRGRLSMLYYVKYNEKILRSAYESLYHFICKNTTIIGILRKLRLFCANAKDRHKDS